MRLAIFCAVFLMLLGSLAAEEALFFVTDVEGDTLFAVYPNGVIIKNEQGDKLFTAESDSIRAYVYDSPDTRSSRGGFAIGGVASTTRTVNDYFHVSSDSVRIYLEDEDTQGRTSRGGFAIGGVASTTRNNDYYFNLERGQLPEIIAPSQPRMLWYPAREAVRLGRVLVTSPDSVGQNSLATGYESKAIGDYSQALGYQARAVGDFSTAIGYNAVADGQNTYALGDGARAIGTDSFALGFGATASGAGSFAFGSVPRDSLGAPIPGFPAATSEGIYSTAFGLGSYSDGVGAMAFGLGTQATEYCALAMGNNSHAEGSSSVAIGRFAQATDYLGIALGYSAEATNTAALALGYNSTASGSYSTAIGRDAEASGEYSFCSATFSEVSGDYATAFGRSQEVIGHYGTAGGTDHYISGDYCTAFGRRDTLVGYGSSAIGGYNTVNGDYAVALGNDNYIVGSGSIAAGYNNETTGHYSTAIGRDNLAAYGAVAIGYDNTSAGQYSFTSGRSSQVNADYGIAMGNTSLAGQDAIAAGYHCEADYGGVAMGYDCSAPGSFSVAMGYHCDAQGQGSVAIGNYAISDNGGFAIGEDVTANNGSVVLGSTASSGWSMNSFLFGDHAIGDTLFADGQNQFRTRCKGGYKFHTDDDLTGEGSVVITGYGETLVGIGTDSPQSKLHLVDEETNTTGVDGVLIRLKNTSDNTGVMTGLMFQNGDQTDVSKGAIFYQDNQSWGRGNIMLCNRNTYDSADVTTADADLTVYYDGRVGLGEDDDVLVYTDGRVGIGTAASTSLNSKLVVAGRIAPYSDNAHDLGSASYRWDDIYATNSVINTSDRRLKENITDLRYGLADLMRLRPVSFTWIDNPTKGVQLGLIAQETQEVIPEVVVQDDPDSYMGLRYAELVPVLVSAVQEQQVIIEEQQQKIDTLAGLTQDIEQSNQKVAQLENELASLRNMVEQLAASAEGKSTTLAQTP